MRSIDEIQADSKPKRPFSNHSEYDYWASDRGCYECVHDDSSTEKYCPILSVALLGSWPAEWTRRTITWGNPEAPPTIPAEDSVLRKANGDPWTDPIPNGGTYEVVDECIEFEERRDDGPDGEREPEPEPPPVSEGQLDLIDAYLDTAIGELTKAPALAGHPNGES